MQGMVCLLTLFGLCFAVERAVCELRGRAPTLPVGSQAQCSLGIYLARPLSPARICWYIKR
jgi:hypothetical protein